MILLSCVIRGKPGWNLEIKAKILMNSNLFDTILANKCIRICSNNDVWYITNVTWTVWTVNSISLYYTTISTASVSEYDNNNGQLIEATVVQIKHSSSWVMGRLLPVVKVVFILLLLGAFLYLMARPSLDKFIQGGVMVEVSTDSTEGLIAPAITFCAKDPAYTYNKQINSQLL